jgi:hypothetical protein
VRVRVRVKVRVRVRVRVRVILARDGRVGVRIPQDAWGVNPSKCTSP